MFQLFFLFKQKTAYEMRISDWSSDVCSSDLIDIVARTPWFQHQPRRSNDPNPKSATICNSSSGCFDIVRRIRICAATREVGLFWGRLGSKSRKYGNLNVAV